MAKIKQARAGDRTFEVFGRDHAERPLQHLGTVRAENKQLAIAHARFVYSERLWVEMCLSPTYSFSGCMGAGQDGMVGMA